MSLGALHNYQEIATAYNRLTATGDRRPAVTIAAETGRSVRGVHSAIRRARKAGLLLPGVQGRAGFKGVRPGRASSEPCGGGCPCESLHQHVRELAAGMDSLRAQLWAERRARAAERKVSA